MITDMTPGPVPAAPPKIVYRRYVIADASGNIVRVVLCTEDQASVQPLPSEIMLESDIADHDTHHVVNGTLVAYSPTELTKRRVRPQWSSGWNNITMDWIDPRNLAQKQEDKWEEIKQIRAQKEFGPFIWDNSEFDADSESQRRIQGAAQLAMIAAGANQSFSIDWTLADNTVRTLSGADMISVGLALGTHVATQYEIARTLRTAIEATTTEEELNAITWPT